jgi:DNA-directed RNA polymerase beta subunit
MNLDDVKRQFVEQVKLRAYDDKYVDKQEEREILQIALQQGVTVDSARGALASVCENNGYVLESKVQEQIKGLVETFADNDGKIDEKEFNDTVAQCKKLTQGKKNDVQCKRMVIEVIEDNSYKRKTGWFSDWYTRVKKDVGMA